MDVQKKSFISNPFASISIRAFLQNFKTAYNNSGFREGAATWLSPHYMKEPAKAALSYRVSAKKDCKTQKGRALTTYKQTVNFVLRTYTTNAVIAVAASESVSNKYHNNMSAACFSETLWKKGLRGGRVYDESRFKGMFIKGLCHANRFSMRQHMGLSKGFTLQSLARYATSSSKRQEATTPAASRIRLITVVSKGR